MEFQISLFQVLVSFLLVLFMVITSLRKSEAKNLTQKLIPGPWKFPLIGNLHQLPVLGDFMCLQLAQVSTVVASSPEMAKEIMKTHDIVFANRPFLVVAMTTTYECTDIVFAPYGTYWRYLRKICTSELLKEEVLNLVKTIKSNEGLAVNLTDKVFSISYAITARAAFGKTCKDQEVFISVVAEETKVNSGSFVSEFFPSLKFLDVVSGLKHRVEKIHGEADRIVGDIVNDHKESRAKGRSEDEDQEDLVDDGEFPLTDNNIKAILFDIFIGGSETLATAIEWAMSEMIKNPRVMKKAQAEVRQVFEGKGNVDETGIHQLKYLNCVIKKTHYSKTSF
ncbi:hypothetical protein ES288_D13G168000v1 [Gossypium darwinii]|uniref:Cytochrome P450 n=1 Tax=Gossypium darwinii TaxID=34276 RepID=A0A5D2A037_GOSDA|nr:hypothetical protein ES288_D13G168000v1 [Gossypium darwinii]